MCSGDFCTLGLNCDFGPDYVCADMDSSLVLAIPRDLRTRIPATIEKDTDREKSLKWSAHGLEYEAWSPSGGRLLYGQPIWGKVGFVGHDVLAIRVAVYKQGKVDVHKPEAVFLYNPEHGVLAFDYPFGSESGEIVFRSYWLDGKCGLIPIEPCHERPTR